MVSKTSKVKIILQVSTVLNCLLHTYGILFEILRVLVNISICYVCNENRNV